LEAELKKAFSEMTAPIRYQLLRTEAEKGLPNPVIQVSKDGKTFEANWQIDGESPLKIHAEFKKSRIPNALQWTVTALSFPVGYVENKIIGNGADGL